MMDFGNVGMVTFSKYMESHKIPWFQSTNQSMLTMLTFCCGHEDFDPDQQFNNFLTRKPRFFAGDILVIFMFLKIDSNFATVGKSCFP